VKTGNQAFSPGMCTIQGKKRQGSIVPVFEIFPFPDLNSPEDQRNDDHHGRDEEKYFQADDEFSDPGHVI
jgi:hypothetical protein